MKTCSRCELSKDIECFSRDKSKSDGRKSCCKECDRIYNKNNKTKRIEWQKKYDEKNKEKIYQYQRKYRKCNKGKIRDRSKSWYENNKNRKKIKTVDWYNSYIKFTSESKYRKEIELYEEVKESTDGNLMCKCAYCGEWFEPVRRQIASRIDAINGKSGKNAENRLYCSQKCKDNCPVYRQHLYSKDQKPATSREVQPELRQLVFERDNYTCQKCSTHRDNLEVGIHCHHKEGILWEPIQSADVDMCITLCECCHKEVHSIDGCGYNDLKCA